MKKYLGAEKWKYLLYVMTHPADGYYEIRHRDRGSLPIAFLLIVFYAITITFSALSAGFIVNEVEPNTMDLLGILSAWAIGYVLFCVGNWSITCLFSGEGRLKDILIVVGYATLPMSVFSILGTMFSWLVTEEEKAFYTMIVTIGTVWTVFLALLGIMTVHNYTLLKTVLTVIATILAMAVIIFIYLMLNDLISQVLTFFKSVYTELLFR